MKTPLFLPATLPSLAKATFAIALVLALTTSAQAQRGGDKGSDKDEFGDYSRGSGIFGDNLTLDSGNPFTLIRDTGGVGGDFYEISPDLSFLNFHNLNTRGGLPVFRYSFNAPAGALTVNGTGVGIGASTAPSFFDGATSLHVLSDLNVTDTLPFAKVTVENRGHSSEPRTLVEMVNPGGSQFAFTNPDTARTWTFQTNPSDNFLINLLGSGGNEFSVRKTGRVTMGPGGTLNFVLDEVGNLTVLGTVTPMSDRNMKKDFVEVNTHEVLDKIAALPITTWQYKRDPGVLRHIGPMAQDFHAAFNVGKDDKTISVTDAAGVSLAGIQALNQRCDQLVAESAKKDEVINDLESRLEELTARMTALEALIPQ